MIVTVTGLVSAAAVNGRLAEEAMALPEVATGVLTGREDINKATRPAIATTLFSREASAVGNTRLAEASKVGSPVITETTIDTTCITLKKAGDLENSLETSSAKNVITLEVVVVAIGIFVR